MVPGVSGELSLASLDNGISRISSTITKYFAEACVVCLHRQKHKSGVELKVAGISSVTFKLLWDTVVTDDLLAGWGDEATEHGAYAIAFLVMPQVTDFTAIWRARTGTGVDYWLGYERPNNILENAARLEVSGILKGNKSSVNTRLEIKKKQTWPTDGELPAYIVIAEFSKPLAQVVLK